MVQNGWTEELNRLNRELADTKNELTHARETIRRYEQRFDDFHAFINVLCDMLQSRIAEHQFGERGVGGGENG